jgi:methionyl-tRNA formyltransferase
MNIYRSEAMPGTDLPVGTLTTKENRLLVGCGKGSVELKEIQLPGTKRMSGLEFANGYDIRMKLS